MGRTRAGRCGRSTKTFASCINSSDSGDSGGSSGSSGDGSSSSSSGNGSSSSSSGGEAARQAARGGSGGWLQASRQAGGGPDRQPPPPPRGPQGPPAVWRDVRTWVRVHAQPPQAHAAGRGKHAHTRWYARTHAADQHDSTAHTGRSLGARGWYTGTATACSRRPRQTGTVSNPKNPLKS